MPWALLTCEDCGRLYEHYPVGEVERWIRTRMNPRLRADKSHFARQVKRLEALCPYCREVLNGMPYGSSRSRCSLCGETGRNKRGQCRGCGGPTRDISSKIFSPQYRKPDIFRRRPGLENPPKGKSA